MTGRVIRLTFTPPEDACIPSASVKGNGHLAAEELDWTLSNSPTSTTSTSGTSVTNQPIGISMSRRFLERDHPLRGKIEKLNPILGKIMTDLNSLVVFAHVVDANSFSGAARILKMPTSTVSRRIAELEDQLGIRLLERSTRKLRLTDAGSRGPRTRAADG
jgi:hypothetical protein